MKLGRVFLGLLSGLTFGMLFAPRRGKDLRKELCKKSEQSPLDALRVLGEALMDAGGEAYAEFMKLSEHEQVKALKTLSEEKLGEFMEKAKEQGFEIAEKVQEKLDEASAFLTEETGKKPGRKKKS